MVAATQELPNKLWLVYSDISSFEHLYPQGKYPDIVTLPEGLKGDYIVLRNPKLSGFELMIVWKIHLDEGRTTPVLDLLTKVPEQGSEQRLAALAEAPARFRSMLRLVGVETAIENLIQALSLQQ
ncbi:PREDICTED: centromere protein P [Merops nubicus]|uniref:centromere protein P n=1 Tax=Merops nubicus TaxID=57421 RepID=UPI0004F09054|nr:PREDICTED: centromere protein P [Merops nubicus]